VQASLDYDVVIIGAGPAGSMAAIFFKRALPALRIALIDKATFPRDKVCGDGLGPGVLGLLEDAGLDEIARSGRRLDAVVVRGPTGAIATGALPALHGKSASGAVMERRRFDNGIYTAAIEAGAEDLTGWRFVDTEVEGSGRTVRLSRGDETKSLTASLLVGADGAGSRVRASLGVKRNRDRHTGIGIRAYADVTAPDGESPDELLLDWDEQLLPGYGWVFPLEDGRANIGAFMVVADRKKRGIKTVDLLDDYVWQLGARGYIVENISEARTYLLPNAAGMPQLTHRRAALIGDAASMINPWSGEGIFYGMAAGQVLATATANHLQGGDGALQQALSDFERRFRKRFSWHLRSCSLAQSVTRSKRLSAGILDVADDDQAIFEYLVALMFGEGVIGPRMLARLVTKGLWRSIRNGQRSAR
jgi:geranylgeranyl reductase family protein